MQLWVKRTTETGHSTIGELYIDSEFFCYTLEDVVRAEGIKIPGQTAISAGVYSVQITRSERFKRELPLLVAVPNFTGIRMHPGCIAADTEGCILVGYTKLNDELRDSRLACDDLMKKLKEAAGPVFITITNEFQQVVRGAA